MGPVCQESIEGLGHEKTSYKLTVGQKVEWALFLLLDFYYYYYFQQNVCITRDQTQVIRTWQQVLLPTDPASRVLGIFLFFRQGLTM